MSLIDAFSLRETVSTSLENAPVRFDTRAEFDSRDFSSAQAGAGVGGRSGRTLMEVSLTRSFRLLATRGFRVFPAKQSPGILGE